MKTNYSPLPSLMRGLPVVVIMLLVWIISPFFVSTPAYAADHTVCAGGGCDYTSIQAAITAAGAGDTIKIQAGTYTEDIVLDKSVNLIGAGDDVVTWQPTATGIPLQISNPGADLDIEIAGITFSSSNERQLIQSLWTGTQTLALSIHDCTFYHEFDAGYTYGNSPWGIYIKGAYNKARLGDGTPAISIANNTFSTWGGILLENVQAVDVLGNTLNVYNEGIVANHYAATVLGDMRIQGNTLNRTEDSSGGYKIGINLWFGSPAATEIVASDISNNTIADTFSDWGILCGVTAAQSDNQHGYSFTNNTILSSVLTWGGNIADFDDLDMPNNYWGSYTGPTHSANIGGTGTPVSDGVVYSPWSQDVYHTEQGAIPTKLIFSTQPGWGYINTSLTTQPVVQAVNDNGVRGVNFHDAEVTLTIEHAPEPANLGGITTRSAYRGQTLFSGVSVDTIGHGFTLEAAPSSTGDWSGLTPAVSNDFDIINRAPYFNHQPTNQTAVENQAFSYEVPSTTDLDGHDMTLSAQLEGGGKLPDWLSFDPDTGTFSGTPPVGEGKKSYFIEVIVMDEFGDTGMIDFTLYVNREPNDPPSFDTDSENQTVIRGTELEYTAPEATDPENGVLTYSAESDNGDPLPDWLSFDPDTRIFRGTPGQDDESFYVKLTATDEKGETAEVTFRIIVEDPPVPENTAPVFTDEVNDQMVGLGENVSITVPEAMDADGDTVTYEASLTGTPLPDWLSFDPGTRTFRGMPGAEDTGDLNILVTASDGNGGTDKFTFTLTVEENRPPEFTSDIPAQTVSVSQTLAITVPQVVDADGNDVTLSAQLEGGDELPDWLIFDPDTGAFSGTPPVEVGGTTYTIVVTVADQWGDTSTLTFTLTVEENRPPEFVAGIDTQIIQVGENVSITVPEAVDPDGDDVTYNTTELPNWLIFEPGTRTFSGMPGAEDTGELLVVVTATDGIGTDTLTFTLTVEDDGSEPENQAPQLVAPLEDQTVTAGQQFSYTLPEVVDPDGDPVTEILKRIPVYLFPNWLSYDEQTRIFSGVPGHADVEVITYVLYAHDDKGGSLQEQFTITVLPVDDPTNTPPQFVGPQEDLQAISGEQFSFELVEAQDADGDPLVYHLELTNAQIRGELPFSFDWDPETHTLSGKEAVGTWTLSYTVYDNRGGSDQRIFTLTVFEKGSQPQQDSVVYLPLMQSSY